MKPMEPSAPVKDVNPATSYAETHTDFTAPAKVVPDVVLTEEPQTYTILDQGAHSDFVQQEPAPEEKTAPVTQDSSGGGNGSDGQGPREFRTADHCILAHLLPGQKCPVF
jgi:hypothetical protein